MYFIQLLIVCSISPYSSETTINKKWLGQLKISLKGVFFDFSLDMTLDPQDEAMARRLDEKEPLRSYRSRFHIPWHAPDSREVIYFCGNSLGLQPKASRKYLNEELDKWETLGVEGHFSGNNPWVGFDELCVEPMAKIIGAKPMEVVLMNSLTVNLHFMLATFYCPTQDRFKILTEEQLFPSDKIALISQIKLRGYDPDEVIILLMPRKGELLLRHEDILTEIKKHGSSTALVFFEGVNYFTGQTQNIQEITKVAKSYGCSVGWDLAHAVGNVHLEMNQWGPDFAVWCTYKYLNAGPGGIGGCFVHERHGADATLPRLSGWWSHEKRTRFLMKPDVILRKGALGYQQSNPSIMCLALLRASLELYEEVGMEGFLQKSKSLTGSLRSLLKNVASVSGCFRVITPKQSNQRGCQISITFTQPTNAKIVLEELRQEGVIVDLREPGCLRIAPNPFYNTYMDVIRFIKVFSSIVKNLNINTNEIK